MPLFQLKAPYFMQASSWSASVLSLAFVPTPPELAEGETRSTPRITTQSTRFTTPSPNGRRFFRSRGRLELAGRSRFGSICRGEASDVGSKGLESCSWLWGGGSEGALPSIQLANTMETFNAEENRFHQPSSDKSSSALDNGPSQIPNFPTLVGTLPSEYSMADSNTGNKESWVHRTETWIERTIFNSRFMALFAVAGSLSGSLVCFLKGCVLICESFLTFCNMCMNGVHTGNMILRLVEAIDVYLAGTVMLIFGMGLYGLFVSNIPDDLHPLEDRALQNSSLYGMFILKIRPKWMQIRSLDQLKTKVGHVIVMILLVKMFERSKTITIATSTELLMYSLSVFLSSASLFVLHKLHH